MSIHPLLLQIYRKLGINGDNSVDNLIERGKLYNKRVKIGWIEMIHVHKNYALVGLFSTFSDRLSGHDGSLLHLDHRQHNRYTCAITRHRVHVEMTIKKMQSLTDTI